MRLLAERSGRRAEDMRLLAVGDSLAHDVLGAANSPYNIDTLYIAGGIDANKFSLDIDVREDWECDLSVLDELKAKHAPTLKHNEPTFAMSYLA